MSVQFESTVSQSDVAMPRATTAVAAQQAVLIGAVKVGRGGHTSGELAHH